MSLFALTASLALAVWPAPQHLEVSGDRLPLSPNFHFVADTDPPSQLLLRALARFESQINSTQIRSEDTSSAASGAPALSQCIVRPHSSSEELKMSTDISYNLSVAVSPDGVANCTLDAPTVFGCVAGLETFVQLLVANITPPTLQNTSIHVEDHPDFVHRGVMADTGRRFWPLPLLRNVIDVMAMSKMNVLHLHASDMCRWAVESLIYPELTRNNLSSGDAQRDAAWSAGFGFYSQADIKALTAYAKDRGVRVVPEFDMPGHAAALRPLVGPENRGLELCNPPFTNGSHIPNWCTLQGGNGSAAQRLLPPLVQEMAELFGGELYHMGGDEPRCGGVYDFEKRIISTIEAQNKRVVAWSEVHGNHAASPSTVIQAWRSPNASALAAQGVAGIETSPRRFYLSGSGTFPGAITGAWCDLWQGANGTRTKANASARALLLGGEVALWTDAYSYINDCVRPGDGPGPSAILWNRTRDTEFGLSIGGVLWPRGFLAAGSFWHYDDALNKSDLVQRVLVDHTSRVAARGGIVCPVGCKCDSKNRCGQPYVPAPPKPPRPPHPTPSPPHPLPPSNACTFIQGAGLHPNDAYHKSAETKEACCGICLGDTRCSGAVSNEGLCHVKHGHPGAPVTGRANTSFVCLPPNRTHASTAFRDHALVQ